MKKIRDVERREKTTWDKNIKEEEKEEMWTNE